MQLIIHAGMPKNGSSAIQQSLRRARKDLLDQSIEVFDTVNTIPMPRTLTDSTEYLTPARSYAARFDGQENLDGLVKENWEAFEAIRKENKTDYLLVSSEMFPQLCDHEKFWDRLTHGFNSVQFIVYLRRPVDFFGSLINQMVRGGKNLHTVFRNQYKMNSLTPAIDIHELCYSRNHPLKFRCFDKKLLIGGDVVEDFAVQISELSGRNISLPKTSANESFSHEALFAMYVYNNFKGADKSRSDWDVRRRLVTSLRELDENNGENTTKLTFRDPLVEQWLIEGYEEQLETLKNKYGVSFEITPLKYDQKIQEVNIEEILWNKFYGVTKSELFANYLSVVMELINQERSS